MELVIATLKIVGSVFGTLFGIATPFILYTLNRRYKERREWEDDTRGSIRDNTVSITTLRQEASDKELDALRRESAMKDRFADLPQTFMPRPEIKAIIEGMRKENHTTHELVAEMRADMKKMLEVIQDILIAKSNSR